jgi:hypothetical protein
MGNRPAIVIRQEAISARIMRPELFGLFGIKTQGD